MSKCLTRYNRREQGVFWFSSRRCSHHDRGGMATDGGENWSHAFDCQEAGDEQEVMPGYQTSRPAPSDPLPPARLHSPKGHHQLGAKCANTRPRRSLHIQTTTNTGCAFPALLCDGVLVCLSCWITNSMVTIFHHRISSLNTASRTTQATAGATNQLSRFLCLF